MTPRAKIECFAAACALAIVALLARSYLEAHADRARLAAALAAEKGIIDRAQQQIDSLDAAARQRDAATAAALAAMQKAAARAQSPEDIARWIPQQLQTPAPISVTVPPATPANPAPDAIARIPQQDLPVLRDRLEACRECTLQLATAQQDLAARQQQLKLAGEQLSATQRQRDAALAAAKGGSFWRRVRRNARWFAIGSAAAAAALCATSHCK